VEKQPIKEVSKLTNSTDNTCELKPTSMTASVWKIDEYARSEVEMELKVMSGESRGYWKYHAPGKWFKQAKAVGKINNEKAALLFDSGAEVSIVDTAFARKVGSVIDESQRQECVGIGEMTYMTKGRTKMKVTLAGSFVYYFDAWVGDQTGHDAILGMDFMVPAGIHLDMADGTLCLPDEVRIQLSGRRQLYGTQVKRVMLDQHLQISVGGMIEVLIRTSPSAILKLWVTRGTNWVLTVATGLGRTKYLQITNLSNKDLILQEDVVLGIWLAPDAVPRRPGFVSIGSRRYAEWLNLAFEATTEKQVELDPVDENDGPLTDRPEYATPTKILSRAKKREVATVATPRLLTKKDESDPGSETVQEDGDGGVSPQFSSPAEGLMEPILPEPLVDSMPKSEIDVLPTSDEDPEDAAICYHEDGDLFAEDVEQHMAVLPEVARCQSHSMTRGSCACTK
jgi:hypothetical protein